ASIGEFDAELQPGGDRRRRAQRLAVGSANERKAAREHATVGHRGEKPSGPLYPGGAVLYEGGRREPRSPKQSERALAPPPALRAARIDIGETRGRQSV